MQIYIASDHGGFELKQELINWLEENDYEVGDMGPFELQPEDDYPEYAFPVAEKVAEQISAGAGVLGILICRSGNGMAIAANKVKGIRAALCFSAEHALKAREHDHANILVLDADYAGESPIEILQSFLNSSPSNEERHVRRVGEIAKYEQSHLQ